MTNISIHAPREGSDSSAPWTPCGPKNFYPRSPRGERRQLDPSGVEHRRISIHAPREGSDPPISARPSRSPSISIHAPREGSDGQGVDSDQPVVISIHAPREGSDDVLQAGWLLHGISIHAPREGSDG